MAATERSVTGLRERLRRRRFISRSRNLVNVSRRYYENVIGDVIDYPIVLSTPLYLFHLPWPLRFLTTGTYWNRDVTAETDGETDPLTSVNQRERIRLFIECTIFKGSGSSFREQLHGTGLDETSMPAWFRSFGIELRAMKKQKERSKKEKEEKREKRKE